MISIELLFSLTPIFILLLGTFLIIFMEDRTTRKSLLFVILLLALILNTLILIGFYIPMGLIERDYSLSLEKGTFTIIEMILLMGLIVSLFSKEEIIHAPNDNLMDGLILIILLGLIGMVITSNILAIFSCFFLVAILIGVIFYFGNFPKEFQLLKLYFIGCGISFILLFFASYLIYAEFNTLILTKIKLMKIKDFNNVIITILLILGLGIPCGLFPFTVYHLKNYYQDSSYTNLYLFAIFSFVNVFLIVRILNAFSYSLIINGIIIMIVASLGLLFSLGFILTELFSSFSGSTFSLKKMYGYSVISDFNMFLLFSAYLVFLTEVDVIHSYLNMLIFYIFIICSVKTLIFYTYYPVMLETDDDNLKLLGQFNKKYPKFGNMLLVSGLIVSIPLSFFSLYSLLSIYALEEIALNSLYSTLSSIMLFLYIFYLAITLIFISISYIQIYFSNKPHYIEKESIKNITPNYYLPIYVIVAIISVLTVLFLVINNVYYDLFESFFLNID